MTMKMKKLAVVLATILSMTNVVGAIPMTASADSTAEAVTTVHSGTTGTSLPYTYVDYLDSEIDALQFDMSHSGLKLSPINSKTNSFYYNTLNIYSTSGVEAWTNELSESYYNPDNLSENAKNFNIKTISYDPARQYYAEIVHTNKVDHIEQREIYYYNTEKKEFTLYYDEVNDSCFGYPVKDGVVTLQGWYDDTFKALVTENGVLPETYELYLDNDANGELTSDELVSTLTPVDGARNAYEMKALEFDKYYLKAIYQNVDETETAITATSGNDLFKYNGVKVYKAESNIKIEVKSKSIYKTVDGDGNIVEKEFPTDGDTPIILENDAHGKAYLYKNADVLGELTKDYVNSGKYSIPEYDDNATYFLKVATDDSENPKGYDFYRWNDKDGKWDFRINTDETKEYTVPVNITAFPDEDAKGIATGVRPNGDDFWTKKDFNSGNKTITLNLDSATEPTATFDYGDDGTATYQYIGIDPILAETTGKRSEGVLTNKTDIPTTANKGDTIVVDGKGENGTPVHFEMTAEEDNPSIPLKDGTYTIVDDTTKVKADVIVDQDESENAEGSLGVNGVPNDGSIAKLINLSELEEVSHYVVKTPDGTIVDEGKVHDRTFDNVDDMNIPEETLKPKSPYFIYEVKKGIENSSEPTKFTKEDGYFVIGEEGKLDFVALKSGLLGDVNISRTVNVQDIIMLQKYLLKQETFEIENFINADMNRDGKVNVIDLALLKKALISK